MAAPSPASFTSSLLFYLHGPGRRGGGVRCGGAPQSANLVRQSIRAGGVVAAAVAIDDRRGLVGRGVWAGGGGARPPFPPPPRSAPPRGGSCGCRPSSWSLTHNLLPTGPPAELAAALWLLVVRAHGAAAGLTVWHHACRDGTVQTTPPRGSEAVAGPAGGKRGEGVFRAGADARPAVHLQRDRCR